MGLQSRKLSLTFYSKMQSKMKSVFVFLSISLFFSCMNSQNPSNIPIDNNTQVAVWDTYVTRKDGRVMHFDIIVPSALQDTSIIFSYGREYLRKKGEEGQKLTANECRLCHVRRIWPQWMNDIKTRGYYILELENCD